MNKEDFTLLRVDRKDGHEDYWYETSKAANEYLTDKIYGAIHESSV